MKLNYRLLAGVLAVSISFPVYGYAQQAVLSEKYTERAPARLGYGVMNTVFGWTELGFAPVRARREGLGRGDALGRALTTPFAATYLGLWDLATFWVPGEVGRSMAVPRYVGMKASGPVLEKAERSSPQSLSSEEAEKKELLPEGAS